MVHVCSKSICNIQRKPSVDKEGNPSTNPGSVSNPEVSNDPNDPNYICGRGMGWFPGYAIDVTTGERLNMAFGEDSWLATMAVRQDV